MDNIDPEKLRELSPQAWWSGYRVGRQETLDDPAVKKQIVEEYLRHNLTQPSPSQKPVTPSPQPSAVTISAEQEKINRLMGISPETFIKYSHETPSQLEPVQAEINRKLGLSEEDYLRHVR